MFPRKPERFKIFDLVV